MSKTCGRCLDTYNDYTFVVRDDITALRRMHKINHVFGQVCEECREEVTNDELYRGYDE